MTAHEPLIRDVSDTALWTSAYRADETDRADALFRDPYARELAGERGREIVRNVKVPAVRYGVVLRTAMIDELVAEAVTEGGFDAVLNLAAGLDTRPYRLDLPKELRWIEVDQAPLLEYKDAILAAETPSCNLERVALDLTDRPGRRALFARVARESRKTVVLTEGLLSYLAPEEVAGLAEDLRATPGFEEWMTDLSSVQVSGRIRSAGDHLKAGNAQARFAPKEGTDFFRPYGWVEARYVSLFLEAPRFGRDSAVGKILRLALRFAPRDARRGLERAIGVVVFRRSEDAATGEGSVR